jgi:NMD protein affecting ribosome stability and mRNA decay
VVEFIVAGQVCDECHRTEAKDTWRAVVQVRQKVCVCVCVCVCVSACLCGSV